MNHQFISTRFAPLLTIPTIGLIAGLAHADVSVGDSGFSWVPADVVIAVGESVHWTWSGFHNVAEVDGPTDNTWNGTGFRSGNPVSSGSFDLLFSEPGVHHYVCEPHAGLGMRGTVTVMPDCPDPSLPAPELSIAYSIGNQSVVLSWDPVEETVGGCPVEPQYRVLAGVDPEALTEVAIVSDTSWNGPLVGDRRFYAVTTVVE